MANYDIPLDARLATPARTHPLNAAVQSPSGGDAARPGAPTRRRAPPAAPARPAAPASRAAAPARPRPRRPAAPSSPGREETIRSSSVPRNTSPTPSSAAQPPGSEPSRTASSQTGRRSGSPSAWTVSEPGSQPEAGGRLGGRAERLGHAALEPAHRAGAQAGQHGPRLPGVVQAGVQAVRAPDRQQVAHRAAADVDQVLVGDDLGAAGATSPGGGTATGRRRGRRGRRSAARNAWICAAGSPDAVGRKRTRGSRAPVQRQREVVQRRVVGLHREAAPAHGEDGRRPRCHAAIIAAAPR